MTNFTMIYCMKLFSLYPELFRLPQQIFSPVQIQIWDLPCLQNFIMNSS